MKHSLSSLVVSQQGSRQLTCDSSSSILTTIVFRTKYTQIYGKNNDVLSPSIDLTINQNFIHNIQHLPQLEQIVCQWLPTFHAAFQLVDEQKPQDPAEK